MPRGECPRGQPIGPRIDCVGYPTLQAYCYSPTPVVGDDLTRAIGVCGAAGDEMIKHIGEIVTPLSVNLQCCCVEEHPSFRSLLPVAPSFDQLMLAGGMQVDLVRPENFSRSSSSSSSSS